MSAPVPPPAVALGRPRLQWIDSARGACVLAVVLFHVCLWQFLPMSDAVVWHPAIAAWAKVNNYLGSLRMPLLLAISGMLASRRIRAGWRQPGALMRASSSYYLYVVWLIVYFVFYLTVSAANLPHRINSVGGFLAQLLIPETPLWYIFALALYVVVLTTARRVPMWLVLAALTVLSVAVLMVDTNSGMFEKVLENAIFFAVGVYGGRRLREFAERRRPTDLLIWMVIGFGSVMLAKWSYGSLVDAILHVVRGVIFLILGAAVVVNLIRWRPLGRLGEFIGRRTLQIYVLHAPLIMIVMAVLTPGRLAKLRPLLDIPLVAALWPLALCALVVGSALLIHRLLLLARLNVMFEMPAALSTWITRGYDRKVTPVAAPGPGMIESEALSPGSSSAPITAG